MSIEKRTVVAQVEAAPGAKALQVKLALLLVEGAKELDRKWHRATIMVNADIAAQLADMNAHLSEMGWPAVDGAGLAYIAKFSGAARG